MKPLRRSLPVPSVDFEEMEYNMNVVPKLQSLPFSGGAIFALWMTAAGFAAASNLQINHGPTFPPSPWENNIAHGPTFPPSPWENNIAHDPHVPA